MHVNQTKSFINRDNLIKFYPLYLFTAVVAFVIWFDGIRQTILPMFCMGIATFIWVYAVERAQGASVRLWKCTSLLIFFHFIFFPAVYVCILRSENNSFAIEPPVVENEKKLAITELDNEYKPREVSETLNFINLCLEKNYRELSVRIAFFEDESLLKIGDHFIYKTFHIHKGPDPLPFKYLIIVDSSGKKIGEVLTERKSEKTSIKELLAAEKKALLGRSKDYSAGIDLVNTDKFWTINKLFAYMTAHFIGDTIKPISKSAHIAQSVHYLVVIVVLAGLIGTQIGNLFKDKR